MFEDISAVTFGRYKELILERLPVRFRGLIGTEFFHNFTFDLRKDDMIEAMVLEMASSVLAEEVEKRSKEVSFTHPATWWEAFKLAYFPDWLRKKSPVKYVTEKRQVTFRKLATYPELPKVFPNHGPIRFRSYIYDT